MKNKNFKELFGSTESIKVFAPGRVNLIGEHTDYNNGLVFPVAINKGTTVELAIRADRRINVISKDFDYEQVEFELGDKTYNNQSLWVNYVKGAFLELQKLVTISQGYNIYIYGNQPLGAGLSSSASLTVALVKAISESIDLHLDPLEAAKCAQAIENNFLNCSCGLMDHAISAMGLRGHALKIDFDNFEVKPCEIPEPLSLLVVNSNMKRNLVGSEYNQRRMECESAAKIMQLSSLRQANIDMLIQYKDCLNPNEFKRARHIISENNRVEHLYNDLQDKNFKNIGALMAASHISMRDDFEISIPEIDHLVEVIQTNIKTIGGARMTGGGFGGCVIALLHKDELQGVIEAIAEEYTPGAPLAPSIYDFKISDGAYASEYVINI